MQNNVNDLVSNKLELNENLVWVLDKNKKFGYSDGVESEQYLRTVLAKASDISSNSYELESYIKDWNSEYHLSRKRAQLLKGFNYDKSKKVLEVGCGCGAITRFLGETFDNVTAIEGSTARAGIARSRTRDLENVSIICAPFQEIKFTEKFDIIFCIGVFEYSNMFVNSDSPYEHILKYFDEILNTDGEIVIAIENQFGLKYFTSSPEDHSSVMFDGLEGYTRFGNRNAKTFGYNEMSSLLQKYFPSIQYYFPFPDYKMPSCILSKDFIDKASAGELVGNFNKQTNYLAAPKPLFDEKLVLLELSKNNMLHFFSNSFLIFASKSDTLEAKLDDLGLMYSQDRLPQFQTITRFTKEGHDDILVHKEPLNGQITSDSKYLTLKKCTAPWLEGLSLSTQIMKRVKDHAISLEDMFSPVKTWYENLKQVAEVEEGHYMLDGIYLDFIWSNTFIVRGDCKFIDQEWEWKGKVKLNRLFIKSFFEFLTSISFLSDLHPELRRNSKASIIKKIARSLDIQLNKQDFQDFIETEAKIAEAIYGNVSGRTWKYYMNLELHNNALASSLRYSVSLYKKIMNKFRI